MKFSYIYIEKLFALTLYRPSFPILLSLMLSLTIYIYIYLHNLCVTCLQNISPMSNLGGQYINILFLGVFSGHNIQMGCGFFFLLNKYSVGGKRKSSFLQRKLIIELKISSPWRTVYVNNNRFFFSFEYSFLLC